MNYCRIGIDLGVTSEHVACVDGEEGDLSNRTMKIPLTKEDLDRLCARAKEKTGSESIHFICEATGMSWFPLALYAKKMGHCISKIRSHSMATLRRFSKRKRKSDHLDARILVKAPLIDEDSLQEIQLPDALTFALKRACRQRDKFTRECTRIKDRILSFCHWAMPGVKECFDDPFSDLARSFYWHFTDPFKAKKQGNEGIPEKRKNETGGKVQAPRLRKVYHRFLCKRKVF